MPLHHNRYQTLVNLTPLLLSSLLCAICAVALEPSIGAAVPENELKLAGAIPLTTELFDKIEKFYAGAKSDAAVKAELVGVTKENKDNPPMTGEAWGSLITAKCPKTLEIFRATGLTPEELGKAAHAIESIIIGEEMA
ncbi:MAG: hypothetical protein ACJ8M1_04125, partial [Chthoniobacterales bacterium]